MVFNNVILRVSNPEDTNQIEALLIQQATISKKEIGCERFEVYQSQSDRELFFLIEQWESEEALDAHRKTENFLNVYMTEVVPKVQREPHLSSKLI